MIISMRAINCNNWINSNWGPRIPMPTPITDFDNLYYLWFYEIIIGAYTIELHKLYVSINFFYFKAFYYRQDIDILAEDNYLYENN